MADRLIDPAALERALSAAWSRPVLVRACESPLDPSRLTPSEAASLEEMIAPPRRASWLLGRAALKELLEALGEDGDTSLLRFPHPRVSLSHSGGWAVALGVPAPGGGGIGVDLEVRRAPRPGAERKFLAPSEISWIEAIDPARRPHELLRLWTVKEAAFKADPDNAGLGMAEYVTDRPELMEGAVRRGGRTFRVFSSELPGGFLSAALLPGVEPGVGRG